MVYNWLFRCYSQVGKTGGKQEISLGRGCLYHEIVLHELMHSIGAWHEHSRAGKLILGFKLWIQSEVVAHS